MSSSPTLDRSTGTGPNGSGKSSALKFIAERSRSANSRNVQWSEPRSSGAVVVYIPTHRQLQFEPVKGVAKIEYDRKLGHVSTGLSQLLLQYLVNRKAEVKAFSGTDGDSAHEAEVKAWFDGFQETLRWLFEDLLLTLAFDTRRFDFTIKRGDGSSHDLHHLADGHGAFLSIFAEITLGIDRHHNALSLRNKSSDPGPPTGVVILDEIGYLCESRVTLGGFEIDHRVPKGEDPSRERDWTNLFPICAGCNKRRKKTMPPGGLLEPASGDGCIASRIEIFMALVTRGRRPRCRGRSGRGRRGGGRRGRAGA